MLSVRPRRDERAFALNFAADGIVFDDKSVVRIAVAVVNRKRGAALYRILKPADLQNVRLFFREAGRKFAFGERDGQFERQLADRERLESIGDDRRAVDELARRYPSYRSYYRF